MTIPTLPASVLRLRYLAAVAALLALVAGCEPDSSPATAMKPDAVNAAELERFSQLRIAFAHQSVGNNILAGLRALSAEQHVPLALDETREPIAGPGMHHFMIGINEQPQTKIVDFDKLMHGGMAQSADLAILKLCFADFVPQVEPQALARSYIGELEKLSGEYPQTTFVPVTAPLMTVQTGFTARIKKILGIRPAGYEANERRFRFNQALREHSAGKGVLFDIASLESDAGNARAEFGGEVFEALDPAYTTDGGHLNDAGQKLVASALVHHVVRLRRQ
jgi:lysophospholipase L1-like esterase